MVNVEKQCIAPVRLLMTTIITAYPKLWSRLKLQQLALGLSIGCSLALYIDDCAEANWCSLDASTYCGAESFYMERCILVRDMRHEP